MKQDQIRIIKKIKEIRDSDDVLHNSNKLLGKAVPISSTVISHLCSGDERLYPKSDDVWDKLARFCRTYAASARKLPLEDFIDLTITNKIMSALQVAHQQGDCAMVYGLSGASKTYSATRYAEHHSGVVFATASPASNSVYGILALIAQAAGCEMSGSVSAAKIEMNIVDKLHARGGARLLIIDEAHHLSQKVLDQVRCVYDKLQPGASSFGLAIFGNRPLVTEIARRPAAPQLLGRVGLQMRIDSIDAIDVATVLSAAEKNCDRDKQLLATAKNVVAGAGGLRRLIKVTQDAMMLATAEGVKIAAVHFQTAEQARAAEADITRVA